jgi:tRNA (guanine37-N1)-methyltransferase
MTIYVVTLFPEMFASVLSTSILKRAIGTDKLHVAFVQLRDFTNDKYGRVDTPPVGGGAGLVLKVQPIVDALASIKHPGKKILLTPRGKPFVQATAHTLSKLESMTLICGHYEGFDERVHDYVDDMVSLGDFILTGGEIAALAIIDAVARLLPGVIDEASPLEESFSNQLLEYPQYTEPYEFHGKLVPDILYSGHHGAIADWRLKHALRLTRLHRPDLFNAVTLSKKAQKLLLELDSPETPEWEQSAIKKGKKDR